jgi:hypothetical protein
MKPYGPRGVAMLALAVLAAGRSIAYVQPTSPPFTPDILIELDHIIPTIAYGILWALTAVVVTVGAFQRKQVPALAVIAGMSILWALVYSYAAATRTVDAGIQASIGAWITATVYLALAVIIGALAAMINKVETLDSHE